jgi:hypothetical protein
MHARILCGNVCVDKRGSGNFGPDGHPLERLTRLPEIGPKGDLSGNATYQEFRVTS